MEKGLYFTYCNYTPISFADVLPLDAHVQSNREAPSSPTRRVGRTLRKQQFHLCAPAHKKILHHNNYGKGFIHKISLPNALK